MRLTLRFDVFLVSHSPTPTQNSIERSGETANCVDLPAPLGGGKSVEGYCLYLQPPDYPILPCRYCDVPDVMCDAAAVLCDVPAGWGV